MSTLKEIIRLAKELPESCLAEVYEYMESAKQSAKEAEENAPAACPRCGEAAVKNGKKDGKQSYICKNCRRSFLERATSALAHSQASDAVWKAVIRDTINGVSLDATAADLELAHSTVFNMRHKILRTVEQAIEAAPVRLEGACQTDETYVLENEKGVAFSEFHHRQPRQNGIASRPGLSDEYICLTTSITSENKIIACAVNRATPSKEEIERVLGDRIEDDTILLVDGNKSYAVLKDRCVVVRVEKDDQVQLNHFHSFIKERLRRYRGVATIYLNRYAALFTVIFGKSDDACDAVFALMQKRNGFFTSIDELRTQNLLVI